MDFTYMSKNQYEVLASIQHAMIRYYLVEGKKKELNDLVNKFLPVTKMNGVQGYYRNPKDMIALILPIYDLPPGQICIKFSGDGRRCGKRRSEVLLTLSVLSAGTISTTPDHHFTLALWEGKEDYEKFKTCLGPLFSLLEELQENGIVLDGGFLPFDKPTQHTIRKKKKHTRNKIEKRKVLLFLSGDWKFLAILLGIKAASAVDFCIWCLASKHETATKDFFRLRNMEDVLKFFTGCSHEEIPGQEREPLLKFIPFERVIIDPLHAFLRIGEKLIDLVFEEALEVNEAICSVCQTKRKGKFVKICSEGCNCGCHINSQTLIADEMHTLGISRFEFFESKAGKTEWTSLQGDEKIEVLRRFNLSRILLPERAKVIGELWSDFLVINRSLYATIAQLEGKEPPPIVILQEGFRGQGPLIPLSSFPQSISFPFLSFPFLSFPFLSFFS